MSSIDVMISSINIFGLGSDPIAIAFAIIMALAICQQEIKEKKYTNALGVFIISYAIMFSTAIASNLGLFITILILGSIGIILGESIKRE